jgi:hypothetical protein
VEGTRRDLISDGWWCDRDGVLARLWMGLEGVTCREEERDASSASRGRRLLGSVLLVLF